MLSPRSASRCSRPRWRYHRFTFFFIIFIRPFWDHFQILIQGFLHLLTPPRSLPEAWVVPEAKAVALDPSPPFRLAVVHQEVLFHQEWLCSRLLSGGSLALLESFLKAQTPNLKCPTHLDVVELVELVAHEEVAGFGSLHPTFFWAPHSPASTVAPTVSSNPAPTLGLLDPLTTFFGFAWISLPSRWSWPCRWKRSSPLGRLRCFRWWSAESLRGSRSLFWRLPPHWRFSGPLWWIRWPRPHCRVASSPCEPRRIGDRENVAFVQQHYHHFLHDLAVEVLENEAHHHVVLFDRFPLTFPSMSFTSKRAKKIYLRNSCTRRLMR